MPTFSVIIPTFNRSSLVCDAIQSVLNQSFHDYEIVVVDDGSADNTAEHLSRFGDRITYFKQPNGGVASARNQGIAIAKGDYIAYLDSDDLWLSNKLEEVYRVLKLNPAIQFLFSDFRKQNLNLNEPYALSNTDIFSYLFDYSSSLDSLNCCYLEGDNLLRLLFRGYPLYPSTFVIKREVHDQYRWDPGILKSEDFNLALKLSCRYRFYYLHHDLTRVRVHDNNKSSDFVTKNRTNISSMKMARDLYLPIQHRRLCNYYISRKHFADAKDYFKKGRYQLSSINLLQSFSYLENWSRLLKSLITKLRGRAHAR